MFSIIYDKFEARHRPGPHISLPDFMPGDVVEEAQQGSVRCRQCLDDGVALRVEDREPGSFRQRRGAHGSQLRRARPYQCARGEGEEAWSHALLGSWLRAVAAAVAMDSGLLSVLAVLKLSELAG